MRRCASAGTRQFLGVLELIFVVPVGADMRIDQLAAQERERGLVVQLDVVERIGENFGRPYQPGLHVLYEKQLHGAKYDAADPERQPDCRDLADEFHFARPWREQAE